MILVNSIAILIRVLCCATLVVSVFPLVMMPYRIFQIYREEIRLELDNGDDSDNPWKCWITYALLVVGVVFSLFQLGCMCRLLAVAVGSACVCLLALICLFCNIAVVVYMRVVRCLRPKAKGHSTES